MVCTTSTRILHIGMPGAMDTGFCTMGTTELLPPIWRMQETDQAQAGHHEGILRSGLPPEWRYHPLRSAPAVNSKPPQGPPQDLRSKQRPPHWPFLGDNMHLETHPWAAARLPTSKPGTYRQGFASTTRPRAWVRWRLRDESRLEQEPGHAPRGTGIESASGQVATTSEKRRLTTSSHEGFRCEARRASTLSACWHRITRRVCACRRSNRNEKRAGGAYNKRQAKRACTTKCAARPTRNLLYALGVIAGLLRSAGIFAARMHRDHWIECMSSKLGVSDKSPPNI